METRMTWEEIKAKRDDVSKKQMELQLGKPALPDHTFPPNGFAAVNCVGISEDGISSSRSLREPLDQVPEFVTWLASLFPDAARKGIGKDANPKAARHNPEPSPHDQICLAVKMLGEYVSHHPTSCGCVSCLVLRMITEACNQMQGG